MLFQPALLPNIQLDLDSVTDLPDLPPLWALHDLFPCHRLSLVAAPTGSGLTQLACHLASAIATQPGIPTGQVIYPAANPDGSLPDRIVIPNETGPKTCPSVLLISRRDHSDVLKPRLQELGVDPDQVLILSQIHREYPNVIGKPPRSRSAPFSLEDLDALSELLHEHTTIRLVLIDNADLLFAATNDPARAKVQRDLDALANIAEYREVAIVLLAGVPHLQRNPFASRLFAAMRDACRLVYFLAPDLEDPQQRLLFCIKNTLSRFTSTRKLSTLTAACPSSFRALNTELQSFTLPHYFTLLHQQRSLSHRTGPSPIAHDSAVEFLLHTLKGGPMPAGACRNPAPGTLRYLANEAGCAWGTVERAKKTLQITSHFTTDHWTWHLPATIPQLPSTCLPSPSGRGAGGEGAVPGIPPSIFTEPAPTRPLPNPPSSSDTRDQVPAANTAASSSDPASCYGIINNHYASGTCASAPPTTAQPSIPPEDAPLHPTPARTCASGGSGTRGSGASPDTCLGRPAPSDAGPSATPTPEPCPPPPSSLNRHSDFVIRISQPPGGA